MPYHYDVTFKTLRVSEFVTSTRHVETIGKLLLNFVFWTSRIKWNCVVTWCGHQTSRVQPGGRWLHRDVLWPIWRNNKDWLLNAIQSFSQQLKIVGFRKETSCTHNAKHKLSQKYVHVFSQPSILSLSLIVTLLVLGQSCHNWFRFWLVACSAPDH